MITGTDGWNIDEDLYWIRVMYTSEGIVLHKEGTSRTRSLVLRERDIHARSK